MIAFMENRGGITDALESGPYADPALVPATPWLDDKPLAPPLIQADVLPHGSVQVTWEDQDMESARQWAVWAKQDGDWRFSTYPAGTRSVRIIPRQGAHITAVNVASVDKIGNANFAKPLRTAQRSTR